MIEPHRGARPLAKAVATVVVLATGLAAASCLPAVAQEATGTFGGEVAVREVLVDVLVTDRAGNVIVGLGEEDFVVEEGGGAVDVESVSFYSNRSFLGFAGERRAEAAAGEIPEDRYFVLFFYNPPMNDSRSSTLFFRLADAGRKSYRWIVEELLPNDHVAVVGYDSRLHLYHDFSRDRDSLGRAIRRVCASKPPEARWASRTAAPAEGEPSLAALPPEEELLDRTASIYLGLEVLAEALGETPGRKNVVLFGIDLPKGNTRTSRVTDTVRYPPMVEVLNDNNVAVYPIALQGRLDQDVLARLAEDTGGEYAYGFATFLAPLKEIARENSGYYLLSYRSERPAGESGYQEIAVRTLNPELLVRARGGYLYGDEER